MSTLTSREQQLIALGLQCYDAQPKIDYNKLATLSGLKNASTASVMYGNAKRKLLGMTPGKGGVESEGTETPEAGAPATTPKKKATPRKRKQATPKAGVEGSGENGEDAALEDTPKKRVRKTPVKKREKSPLFVTDDISDGDPSNQGLDEQLVKPEPTEFAELAELIAPKLEESDGQEESKIKAEY